MKFTFLQKTCSSSIAYTITCQSRFLGMFCINWSKASSLHPLCSMQLMSIHFCSTDQVLHFYIKVSIYERCGWSDFFLASNGKDSIRTQPSAPVCTCCKAASLPLVSMLHSQHTSHGSRQHSRLPSLAQIPLSPRAGSPYANTGKIVYVEIT